MIYILEGSNRVGKTSGINKILETKNENKNKWNVVNNRYVLDEFDDNPKKQSYISSISMLGFIELIAKDKNMHWFIDRFHLSELVYGKNIRGYENEYMFDIDEKLSNIKGVHLILIVSDFDYLYDDKSIDREKINEYIKYQNEFIKYFMQSKIKDKHIYTRNDFIEKFAGK